MSLVNPLPPPHKKKMSPLPLSVSRSLSLCGTTILFISLSLFLVQSLSISILPLTPPLHFSLFSLRPYSPLGGLGLGGMLFLGGRAGPSCFLLKGSSTNPDWRWGGKDGGRERERQTDISQLSSANS